MAKESDNDNKYFLTVMQMQSDDSLIYYGYRNSVQQLQLMK